MKTCDNFEKNLENLKNLILSCKNDSLILAPELAPEFLIGHPNFHFE